MDKVLWRISGLMINLMSVLHLEQSQHSRKHDSARIFMTIKNYLELKNIQISQFQFIWHKIFVLYEQNQHFSGKVLVLFIHAIIDMQNYSAKFDSECIT